MLAAAAAIPSFRWGTNGANAGENAGLIIIKLVAIGFGALGGLCACVFIGLGVRELVRRNRPNG